MLPGVLAARYSAVARGVEGCAADIAAETAI